MDHYFFPKVNVSAFDMAPLDITVSEGFFISLQLLRLAKFDGLVTKKTTALINTTTLHETCILCKRFVSF